MFLWSRESLLWALKLFVKVVLELVIVVLNRTRNYSLHHRICGDGLVVPVLFWYDKTVIWGLKDASSTHPPRNFQFSLLMQFLNLHIMRTYGPVSTMTTTVLYTRVYCGNTISTKNWLIMNTTSS